jgi:hypothetical protein
MLKGQAHTEMNMYSGTLIFFIVSVAIFLALIAPIIYGYGTTGSTENEIRAIEFCNFARQRLLDVMGDGSDIRYSSIELEAARNMTGLGLSENYMNVENVYTGEYWKFGGDSGRFEHDAFSTVKSEYRNVEEKRETVMSAGKYYLVSSYVVGSEGSVAVDVYESIMCSDAAGGSGYRVLSCSNVSVLPAEAGDVDGLRDSVIVPVSTGVKGSAIAMIRPDSDVSAGDLLIAGRKMGSGTECIEKDGMMCFRVMGDYVFPVKIHTEMEKDASLSADVAAGKTGGEGS